MDTNFQITHNGWQIPCKLSSADSGPIRRVVLGVHGIGGSAQDSIQAGIAEEMALFHAATIRFDFPAHGENTLGSKDFTVANCVETLLAVARWGKQRYPEVEDLCIFATGFGAYITLLALEELTQLPGNVRLVVQTPSVLMHETLLSMVNTSRETLWAMDRITLRAPRPLEISYGLYEQMRQNIALTTHPIPMLILQGEVDNYIRMSDIQQFRRINEQAKLVIIPGASHRFQEEGAWNMVLDLTRDWFEFQQVLVTDWE